MINASNDGRTRFNVPIGSDRASNDYRASDHVRACFRETVSGNGIRRPSISVLNMDSPQSSWSGKLWCGSSSALGENVLNCQDKVASGREINTKRIRNYSSVLTNGARSRSSAQLRDCCLNLSASGISFKASPHANGARLSSTVFTGDITVLCTLGLSWRFSEWWSADHDLLRTQTNANLAPVANDYGDR